MIDYWAMLPEKAKTNKKERFNIIMGVIKGEITIGTSDSASNQTNQSTDDSDNTNDDDTS